MEPQKKIEIAKDLIALDKIDNVDDWSLVFKFKVMTDDEKHLFIYDRLVDGEYGEVRDNTEYDDDGEIIKPATEFEIEVGRLHSKTGSPVIFEWEV